MGETCRIECVSIIGKGNNPLYVRNFTDRPDLDLHYQVNIALDAIDEQGMGRMGALQESA